MKINFNYLSLENFYQDTSNNLKYYRKHYPEFEMFIKSIKTYMSKNQNIVIEANTDLMGFENSTTLFLDGIGNYIDSDCTCRFHRSGDPCAHVAMLGRYLQEKDIAVPYFYEREEEARREEIKNYFDNKENEMREINHIKWFEEILKNEVAQKLTEKEVSSIRLVPVLENDEIGKRNFPTLKYKIGKEKLYVVKDLERYIITAIRNQEIKEFGKELKVKMEYDIFDDFSKAQIDFIKKHKDEISYKNTLYLSERNINDFLDVYFESQKDEIVFQEEDFNLELLVTKNKKFYEISVQTKYTNKIDEEKNKFSYFGIYSSLWKNFIVADTKLIKYNKKEKIFIYMDINRYESLLLKRLSDEEIKLSEEKFYEIFSFFKDKLENFKISEDYDKYIEEYMNIKPKIYLDLDVEGNLLFKLKYSSKFLSTNLKQILEIFNFLKFDIANDLNAILKRGDKISVDKTFVIEKKNEIDKFVEEVIPLLYDYSEIFLSQAIKNFNKAKRLNYSVGVKVNSNFLELNFSSKDLEKGEISEILNQYRAKKKYYRLKKGEIILMDKEQMEFLDALMKDLNIKETELKKDKIKVPTYRAYQLEQMEEKFIDVEKDKKFSEIFKTNKIEISEKYKEILRDYQITGVEWLLKLREMNLGGILADDMGLGKTLQVIAYLESSKIRKPCLIVTPASLILNWENEFSKFNSELKILAVHGDKNTREKLLSDLKNEIIITSYDYLKRDEELYEQIDFDTIILDEAQYIKNHKTKVAQSVKKVNSKYKLALTGTPIENSLAELWSIFDFLMSGYLFNYEYFYRYYEREIVLNEDEKLTERLKKMVEPFILRRLKKDVLLELPEKIEETHFVSLSEDEKKLYEANLMRINEILAENFNENNKIEILGMLTKLRQLCIDPRLVYENINSVSSKIKACIEIIIKSIENNEKILLFSSFTTVLDLIAEECEKLKIPYLTLTGSTNKIKRSELVDEFQDGAVPLFLISLKAGGTGLNLTKASVVIHIDPWWNISAQNQATDRAYRIGQENTVQVFNLITKKTIEEKILNLQTKKKELSDIFVEDSRGSFSNLTREELLDLFKI